MPRSDVTMRDIYVARERISPMARRTPLIRSRLPTERVGASLYLKLESLQETGSFKIRGAANKLLSLTADEKGRGVITFSTGNHGLAVSYGAGQLGISTVVCISERVPSYRVDAMKGLGAEVVVCGESQDEAMEHAFRMQEERGLTIINAFEDPFIIAGQGTIGLELLEEDTIADALAGGISLDNRYTFGMVQEYVDDTILVSEEEIAGAMAFALEKHHLVVEGAGAVGIAALLYGRVKEIGRNVVVVISGSNVDLPLVLKIAQNQGDEGQLLEDAFALRR